MRLKQDHLLLGLGAERSPYKLSSQCQATFIKRAQPADTGCSAEVAGSSYATAVCSSLAYLDRGGVECLLLFLLHTNQCVSEVLQEESGDLFLLPMLMVFSVHPALLRAKLELMVRRVRYRRPAEPQTQFLKAESVRLSRLPHSLRG